LARAQHELPFRLSTFREYSIAPLTCPTQSSAGRQHCCTPRTKCAEIYSGTL
jgi:hypothetical protein